MARATAAVVAPNMSEAEAEKHVVRTAALDATQLIDVCAALPPNTG